MWPAIMPPVTSQIARSASSAALASTYHAMTHAHGNGSSPRRVTRSRSEQRADAAQLQRDVERKIARHSPVHDACDAEREEEGEAHSSDIRCRRVARARCPGRLRTPVSSAGGPRTASHWSDRGDTTPSPSPCQRGRRRRTTCRLRSPARSVPVDARQAEPCRRRRPARTRGWTARPRRSGRRAIGVDRRTGGSSGPAESRTGYPTLTGTSVIVSLPKMSMTLTATL